MQTGFKFIEQYQNMSKDIEGETNGIASNFDQEVPRYKYCSLDWDMTQHIKYEEAEPQTDHFSMVESIINNDDINNSAITNAASIKSRANFCSNNNTSNGVMNSHNKLKMNTGSTVISSNLPSFLTPSLSPMSTTTISPLSTCSTVRNMSPSPIISNTNNSGATETNYTHVPNDNFLIDKDCKLFHLGESSEYTDLDTQQVSFYDDYESVHSFSKTEAMPDETRRLEEAVLLMRDTIYNDCDDLNVPYEPMSWTPEHVTKWVSWVCQRNNVPDVSSLLQRFDGPSLCSLNPDTFSIICGNSGVKISNELELWKAANSCFPNNEYISDNSSDVSGVQSQNLNSFMESSQTFNWTPCTPCVSPALSSCSRSSSSTLSTQSDHSDDDSMYGSQISASSDSVKFTSNHCYNKTFTKTPSGRGHKQTIHLWQFLQELLLSKDKNFSDCIRWLDHKTGVFKIEDSKKVATLWGARKNRPAMNYDKLSRSVRQYYKKGIIKKTEQSKRLVYQFCAGYL